MKTNDRNSHTAPQRDHDRPQARAGLHDHAHARARDHARARTPAAPARLFREWQDADAQASAARRRVRLASVADGHGVSDADVCDALLKERRAKALAEQMLARFGSATADR